MVNHQYIQSMKTFNKIINIIKRTAILSALAVLVSCGGSSSGTEPVAPKADSAEHGDHELSVELTPEQATTAGIETGSIEYRTLSGTIKVNGTLDVPPQQLVSVSAPMGGFLQSSELLQGKHVNKGQVIAVMQDQSYIQLQQDYLENNSQLEYLKAEYERQQELAKENINAGKTLQQARANFQTTQATVKGLKAKLQLLHIDMVRLEKGDIQSTINLYAPISGFVTEVNVNMGKYVNPTDVMFEIVDTEHLHAELTVFEKDVPKLKVGQKVRFQLANEATERMATVYLIGREISADRTVRIHCHLDKEDKDLLPGMYLTAWVETKNMKLPAVPEAAVVSFEGKNYIFIETPEEKAAAAKTAEQHRHFKALEVKTGVAELGYVELVSPETLDPKNTVVIVKGAYDLLSKLKNSGEGEEHGH